MKHIFFALALTWGLSFYFYWHPSLKVVVAISVWSFVDRILFWAWRWVRGRE